MSPAPVARRASATRIAGFFTPGRDLSQRWEPLGNLAEILPAGRYWRLVCAFARDAE